MQINLNLFSFVIENPEITQHSKEKAAQTLSFAHSHNNDGVILTRQPQTARQPTNGS